MIVLRKFFDEEFDGETKNTISILKYLKLSKNWSEWRDLSHDPYTPSSNAATALASEPVEKRGFPTLTDRISQPEKWVNPFYQQHLYCFLYQLPLPPLLPVDPTPLV